MMRMFEQMMIKIDLKHTKKMVVESKDEPQEIPNAYQPKSTHFVVVCDPLHVSAFVNGKEVYWI